MAGARRCAAAPARRGGTGDGGGRGGVLELREDEANSAEMEWRRGDGLRVAPDGEGLAAMVAGVAPVWGRGLEAMAEAEG